MKVFITGGTGCIGQYITIAVAEKGHDVTVLSRNPERYTPITKLGGSGSIKLLKGEMTDYPLLESYINSGGFDGVILNALGWGNRPVSMLKNDTASAITLLELSEKAGVQKFIFTSSTAAMGHNRPDMDETFSNLPLNLYGSTKAAIEAYVLGFTEYFPDDNNESENCQPKKVCMKRNIIRPGYTYANPCFEGGASESDGRFYSIINSVINNQPITLTKYDGTQFISAKQIARVYAALLESDLNEQIFLALSSTFTTWERIAEIALEEYKHSTSEIVTVDKGWGASPMLYNVSKIKDVFGLEFKGEDEIRNHIKWCLKHPELLTNRR